jgi:hypothetical protein
VQHHRAFWSAVVLQAHHDIKTEPLRSTDYEQAVAFFTAPGEWRDSLGAIADMLDLHPDDLARTGTKAIKARRLAEGLPEVEEPKPHPRPVQHRPMIKWRPPSRLACGTQACPNEGPPKMPVLSFGNAGVPPTERGVAIAAPAKPRTGKFGHAVQWDFNRGTGKWVHRSNGVF